MGAPVWRVARGVLLAGLSAGCLASPPPNSLSDSLDAAVIDARASDAGAISCEPGALIGGEAFNASPTDPQNACQVDNAVARDGAVAGLDRFGGAASSCSMWGDPELGGCGCVGLDLGGIYRVSQVVVRAAPSGDACGAPCSTYCGSGHTFTTWIGSTRGEYKSPVKVILRGDVLSDYEVEVDADVGFVVVCRDIWGETRDDVVVDSIEVVCQ